MKTIVSKLAVVVAVAVAGAAAAETVTESIDLAGVDRVFEGGIAGGDGLIITNSSAETATITLNVPEGTTATYDGYFGGKINLVKNGGGTQAFSRSNDQNYVHATGTSQINAGTLSICRNENLPYGPHTFADGTCLEINYSFTAGGSSNVYKFLGEVELRIANAGQTATFAGQYVDWEGAVVTKTGPGTLTPSGWGGKAKTQGLRLVIEKGMLRVPAGNTFTNHTARHGITFECHENGRIRCDDNNALKDLVFRGGTLYSTTMQRLGGTANLSCNRTKVIENPLEWKDFSLNGLVTVKASPLGSNTLFRAYQMQIGNEGQDPVIDVEDGATLTIDSEIWPGRYYDDKVAAALRWPGCPYSTASSWVRGSITKRGAGTLELLGPVMLGGTLKVEAGTLVLGSGARLSSSVKLEVAPTARLVLGDRQSVNGAGGWTDADAPDVWFDATRLTGYADGETVAAVPNLGRAGGAFAKSAVLPAAMESGGAQAGLPVYKAAGMNGKPTLWFDGASALMLDTYSNFTNTLSVFVAYDWTSWAAEKGAGRWGTPISLMRADDKTGFRTGTSGGDDNNQYGCFTLQHSDPNKLTFCCGFQNVNWNQMTLTSTAFANVPFVVSAVHNDAQFLFSAHADGVINNDGMSAALKATDPATNSVINRVCLGGRMRYGYPQVFTDSTKSRMLIGNIGELIVFTRALSETERRAIVGYLRGKWANVQVAGAAASPVPDTARRVAVAEGAAAELAVPGAGGTLKKEGAGTLRVAAGSPDRVDVAEGVLRLAPGRLYSRVQMWVDPSDADSVTTDAAGRVVSVRNKGNLGGAFGPAVGKNGEAVATPWTTNINGVAALGFHNEQALVYDGFTNRAARGEAAMNVYMVLRIDDSYELANGRGKWMGAFSMSTVTATADDNNTPGNFHIEWNGDTTNRVPVHGVSSSDTGTYADSTGWKWLSAAQPPYEAALIVIKKRPYSFLAYEEIAADLVTAVTNNMGVYSYAQPAQNIDRVALGNRLTKGGAVQYDSTNAERNRGFNGQIGEFIVTQHALSDEDEKALLAYLRKKWFDKGTGSADAPECLTGAPAGGPDLAGTVLKLADGTTLVDEAACLPLASLEAAAGAGFARRGAAAALFDVAGDISFAGTLTLLMDPLPADGRTTLFTYGGAATEPAAWQILSADAKNTRIVHNVNQKRFEYRVTTPGLTLVIR